MSPRLHLFSSQQAWPSPPQLRPGISSDDGPSGGVGFVSSALASPSCGAGGLGPSLSLVSSAVVVVVGRGFVVVGVGVVVIESKDEESSSVVFVTGSLKSSPHAVVNRNAKLSSRARVPAGAQERGELGRWGRAKVFVMESAVVGGAPTQGWTKSSVVGRCRFSRSLAREPCRGARRGPVLGRGGV